MDAGKKTITNKQLASGSVEDIAKLLFGEDDPEIATLQEEDFAPDLLKGIKALQLGARLEEYYADVTFVPPRANPDQNKDSAAVYAAGTWINFLLDEEKDSCLYNHDCDGIYKEYSKNVAAASIAEGVALIESWRPGFSENIDYNFSKEQQGSPDENAPEDDAPREKTARTAKLKAAFKKTAKAIVYSRLGKTALSMGVGYGVRYGLGFVLGPFGPLVVSGAAGALTSVALTILYDREKEKEGSAQETNLSGLVKKWGKVVAVGFVSGAFGGYLAGTESLPLKNAFSGFVKDASDVAAGAARGVADSFQGFLNTLPPCGFDAVRDSTGDLYNGGATWVHNVTQGNVSSPVDLNNVTNGGTAAQPLPQGGNISLSNVSDGVQAPSAPVADAASGAPVMDRDVYEAQLAKTLNLYHTDTGIGIDAYSNSRGGPLGDGLTFAMDSGRTGYYDGVFVQNGMPQYADVSHDGIRERLYFKAVKFASNIKATM